MSTTKAEKAEFLAMSLNDETSPLWLVDTGEVISAVTGDGPRAEANARLIAEAPGALRYLLGLVARQATRLEVAGSLIADLTDSEPCSFDQHGGCQTHGYLDLKVGETCPQHDAKAWGTK
jgi:hypothetical protein